MNGLTEFIEQALRLDVDDLAGQYTKDLKAAATSANWPVIVIAQLEVVMSNGHYTVYYPDSIREEVELLEYGTETVPPSPVIRNFIASLPQRERA